MNHNEKTSVVGLIPAAGKGSRLGRTPCSKEVFPLVEPTLADGKGMTVLADGLLNAFAAARIEQVYFIIREGKWDIPAYFGDGGEHGLNIGYLMMGLPWGTPFTLDQAYPFIDDRIVATGFPDMRFDPVDIFTPMLRRLHDSGSDVVLAAMPQANRDKWDMIAFDDARRVLRIDIKQPNSDLEYCWFAAVWTPRFTRFMHDHLAALAAANDLATTAEVCVGNVVQAAMEADLDVRCEVFEDGVVTDLGTIAELCRAHPARR